MENSTQTRPSTDRIFGDEIFFNFIELPYTEADNNPNLIQSIKEEKLDGFVMKEVFSQEEIEAVKEAFAAIPEKEKFLVPTGMIFPLSFATLSDAGEKLDEYTRRAAVLESLRSNKAINTLLTRLDEFFNKVSKPFDVRVTQIKDRDAKCAPGNFRFFYPNYGGMFVHCGYLFQTQAPFYYQIVEPMEKHGQLSYFVVLQKPEVGGELTIYDMLWKDVQKKDTERENDYVIGKDGERIYLKDVRSFAVSPKPGDILVFSGGPIWHRVEDAVGNIPRITFGGFLNFTTDGKGLRYWG